MIRKRSNGIVKTAPTGIVVGYASTWTREPDAYGDIVKKGAFSESIAKIKREGIVLPFLFNHDSGTISSYIGTVTHLEEDDHGLKFEAVFDDTPESQRARSLIKDKRITGFSFAYDVLDQGTVRLPDGRKANELRKLDIKEISLTLYPANPDTSVVSIKADPEITRMFAEVDRLLNGKGSTYNDPRLRKLLKEADTLINQKAR